MYNIYQKLSDHKGYHVPHLHSFNYYIPENMYKIVKLIHTWNIL